MTNSAMAVVTFILVYLPLCAVAEAQTMSTEEVEAYLAELERWASLERLKQSAEKTKVLEWNNQLLKDGKVSRISK